MIVENNDEIRRSRMWRIVFTVSSVLIVVIAIFVLMKLFTSNPLEGSWESEDGDLTLTVGAGGSMKAEIADIAEETDVSVKLSYTLDKDAKTITVREDPEELDRLAERSDGAYTQETLKSALASILTTFDYSVDNERLTLTEREYGEQLTFIRK